MVLFELEMSAERLTDRMIISETSMDYDKYRSGYIASHEWEHLSNAGNYIERLPIYIDDRGGVNMRYIKSQAKISVKENAAW